MKFWTVPAVVLMLASVLPAQEATSIQGATAPPNGIWLDSLDLSKMVQRRGTPRVGKSGAGGGRGPGGPV